MREVFEGFGLAPPEEAAIPDDDVPQAAAAVAERARAESCARRLLEALQTGQRPELAQ